jgi:hypothetical protein
MPSLPTPKIKWAGGGIVLAGVVATVIAVGEPSHVDHGVTTCPLPAYPDASCTGYTGSLTTATLNGDGNLRIDDDFAVVDHMDVAGCIDVRGVGVTVKNSNAQCITTSQSARASDGTNPRLTIEDSTVNCGGRLGPLGSTGIAFENFTALRVEVTDCANGLDMFRNATLKDSWIHDLTQCINPDCTLPGGLDDVHTDGIQSGDGSNDIIEHNRIIAYNPPCTFAQSGSCNGTSAININHGLGGPHASNVTIRWNLLAGGANALYCPRVSTTHYVVLENHFSTAYSPNVGLFAPSVGCTVGHEVVAKNVYHETGLPITLP